MKTISRKSLFAFSLLLLMSVLSASAEEIVITGNSVRLRMSPSKSAATLIYRDSGLNVHVNKGDVLECYGHSNGFCKVNYNGHWVWVSSQYAKHKGQQYTSSTNKAVSKSNAGYHPDWITVQGNGVRLRTGASLKSGVYTQVNRGTRLRCIGASGNFWRVNYNGNYLYVSKDFAF